jgi:hypothetical protein
VFLITACGGDQPKSTNPQQVSRAVKRQASKASSAATTHGKKEKEEYAARIEAIVDEYLSRVDALRAEAEKNGTADKGDAEALVADLEAKTAAAKKTLEKLKEASLESWPEIKPEVHAALDDLEAIYDTAVGHRRAEPRPPAARGSIMAGDMSPLEKVTETR